MTSACEDWNALFGGRWKRKSETYGDQYPEDVIALRSFTDVNLPKFTTADLPLFQRHHWRFCFPGVELPPSNAGKLFGHHWSDCWEARLATHKALHNQGHPVCGKRCLCAMVLMTVGIPPCGKDQREECPCWNSCGAGRWRGDDALWTQYVMNPKSITQGTAVWREWS